MEEPKRYIVTERKPMLAQDQLVRLLGTLTKEQLASFVQILLSEEALVGEILKHLSVDGIQGIFRLMKKPAQHDLFASIYMQYRERDDRLRNVRAELQRLVMERVPCASEILAAIRDDTALHSKVRALYAELGPPLFD